MAEMDKRVRYEKKFVVPLALADEVLPVIKSHPALFREIYEERVVNNVYFDTIGLQHYTVHVAGAVRREKVRLRWYGEEQLVKPALEIKLRIGDVGHKESFGLLPMEVSELYDVERVQSLLDRAGAARCGRDLKALRLVLANRYKRSYWLSADERFRLTVDRDICSRDLSWGREVGEFKNHEGVVVELKYDQEDHRLAEEIGQYLPWRVTRNSKYVLGVEELAIYS